MKRRSLITIAVLGVLAIVAGITIWWKMYRVVPQPPWIAADQRDNYFYGSVGGGTTSGIPYWIWLALPRMFPEYLPGPGGYAALGLSWEEGHEMPVGFAKRESATSTSPATARSATPSPLAHRRRGADRQPACSRPYHRHSTPA